MCVRRLLSLFLVWFAGQALAQSEIPTLTFGIVPQQAAVKLAEDWGPLLTEAGRRAGVKLAFRTAPSIPEFEQRLSKGEYDLAYMNPYHYVVFHEAAGYRAFAKEKDRKLKGIIVVRQNSPYQKLTDLSGKSVAFPAPAAFAASILPLSEFGRQGISITPKFVSSHDSVYRAVSSGLQEAGGGIERTFQALAPELRAQLRILAETPPYTPHAFAAHPRVDANLLARVLEGLVSMASDEGGRKLLEPLAMPMGVTAAKDKEWDDIRRLDIRQLEKYTNTAN